MSSFKTSKDVSLEELHCSEFFRDADRDADRDALQAFQHVLVARTSDHPLGIEGEHIEWAEFEQALARFCDLARIRHAAKHYAIREAMLTTKPIVVIRDSSGAMRMLESLQIDPEMLESLKKR
jgi:hypothetical protein